LGFEGDQAIHLFSVSKSNDAIGISQWVIVKHEGSDAGEGSWKCSSQNKEGPMCDHIVAAKKFMKGSSDAEGPRKETEGVDITFTKSFTYYPTSTKQFSWQSSRAVSYLPILPPRWCMLPFEVEFYPQPPPLIQLSDQASCPCLDGGRAFFNPHCPTIICECQVYTLTQAFSIQIQLQPCPRCPQEQCRYIGPEPRDIGLFNFNNSTLFTHELLKEYISAFSSSETPFEPWVHTITRRYEEMHPNIPFVGGGLFWSVWFAYVRLIQFEGDKSCPSCGDLPENIIWDGVSIAFGWKHVNDELEPPTVIQDNAPECSSQPLPHQEWLPDRKMRKKLHEWLADGGLKPNKGGESEDLALNMEACLEHTRILQLELYPWLHTLSPYLRDMFSHRLGHGALQSEKGWSPRKEYLVLFLILSAEESTMQTMTRSSLKNLETFLLSPTWENLQGLLGVPALYTVLELEHGREGNYASDTLGVANWMLKRGKEVMDSLLALNHEPLPGTLTQNIVTSTVQKNSSEIHSWEKTGCCYGLPQI
ncbi:hypothetical protein GYMLUDRAFT_178976, partial [Collybiopsis luxurians FD-317 M1]